MTCRFTTRTDLIALERIEEDEFLTPEMLRIKNHWDLDKRKLDRYLALVGDLHFYECIKVWQYAGKLFLLDNYELFKALKIYHKDTPQNKIHCLVVEGGTQKEIKQLSIRLRHLNPTGANHLSRLLDVYNLAALGFTLREIKRSFGIVNRSEEKMLERDFKITSSPTLTSMILGIKTGRVTTSDILKLNSPEPGKATLPYGLALEILSRLYGAEDNIKIFSTKYERYLAGLREKNIYEDDSVKPIYQWQKFNKKKVLAIASSVARNGDPLAFDSGYLIGDSDLENHKFSVKYNETQYKLTIPQATIDLANKSTSNMKLLVDFVYKMEKTCHSLRSYLGQIRPADHGEKMRPQDITPAPESRSNMPRFEDYAYIRFIEENKLGFYANTELLLKGLELHAHYFGFNNYDYNAESTYKKAHETFEKWFHDDLVEDIKTFYSGSGRRHPKFDIYSYIRSFLAEHAARYQQQKTPAKGPTLIDPTDSIIFGNFVQDLFKHLFRWMDTNQAFEREKMLAISKETLDIRHSDLKKIIWKIRKKIEDRRVKGQPATLDENLIEEIFTTEQINSLFKESRLPDHNRWISASHQIKHLIAELTEAMDGKFKFHDGKSVKSKVPPSIPIEDEEL